MGPGKKSEGKEAQDKGWKMAGKGEEDTGKQGG